MAVVTLQHCLRDNANLSKTVNDYWYLRERPS